MGISALFTGTFIVFIIFVFIILVFIIGLSYITTPIGNFLSRYKWYRKWYYLRLIKYVHKKNPNSSLQQYLCRSTTKKYCGDFKLFPEVINNQNSKHIRSLVKFEGRFDCRTVWFSKDLQRIHFLEECLELLKKD